MTETKQKHFRENVVFRSKKLAKLEHEQTFVTISNCFLGVGGFNISIL